MWDFLIITPEGGPRMKKKRFTEEKIIGILKEHEAGATTAVLARRHGVSEQSIYRWKAKFGGLEVSDAKLARRITYATTSRRLPTHFFYGFYPAHLLALHFFALVR
jgi:putative transposase